MEKNELLKLFKYYRGEVDNPYEPNTIPFKWWEGEKSLLEKVTDDKEIWERIIRSLREAIKERAVSEYLLDDNVSIEKRAICFYLDLWNGKSFPYDSLDDIFEYIKAE